MRGARSVPAGIGDPPGLCVPGAGPRHLVDALTVVVVIAAAWDLVAPAPVTAGGVPLGTATLPALALGAAAARRLTGVAPSGVHRRVWWHLTVAAVAVAAAALARAGVGPTTVAALVVAAAVEELIYRCAVPAVVATALIRRCGRARAVTAGYLVAGAWFVLLPGHRAQMDGIVDVVPFVAGTILFTIVVARTGAVAAAMTLHAVSNLSALALTAGAVPAPGRGMLVAGLWGLAVVVWVRPRVPAPPVVLRGPHPALDVIDLRTVD